MRAVLQRVQEASVSVDQQVIGQIKQGALILLGVHSSDTELESKWLADKLVNLRIFSDENGKMNLSLKEVGASALIVSQFTLYANCEQGRRPSFVEAAPPELANKLYEHFVSEMKKHGISVQTGKFAAYMQVSLLNDGPVTLIVDSKKER